MNKIPKLRYKGFTGNYQQILLGDNCNICTGNKDVKDSIENGQYPFYIRSKSINRIDTYSFDGEAILIGGDGNIRDLIHYANGKFDFHQRVYKLSDFSNNGKYTFHYLNKYIGQELIKNSANTTVDSVRLPTLTKFKMLFPPDKFEQHKVANLLSKIDILINEKEKEIKSIKVITSFFENKLLTKNGIPEIRFSKFNDEIHLGKIGSSSNLITKGTTPKNYEAGNVNYIKVEDITNNNIRTGNTTISEKISNQELKRSILKEGDILCSIAGSLGRSAIVTENILPANTNQAVAFIRGFEGDPNYLVTYFNSLYFQRWIKKNLSVGAQPNLSLEQISTHKLYLPEISEQIKVANIFRLLNGVNLNNELNELKNIRSYLLEKMLV